MGVQFIIVMKRCRGEARLAQNADLRQTDVRSQF